MCVDMYWIQLAYDDKFQRPSIVNMTIKFLLRKRESFLTK
jgi:hypothetical protein